MKRDRRQKTRLQAGSDTERANLRAKALELASSNLRRAGAESQTPEGDKKRLQQVREQANAKREVKTHGGAPKSPDARVGLGTEVNQQKGNPRFGQRFRTVLRKGGEVHDYGNGKRVFVKKPKQGEGSRPFTSDGRGTYPGDTRTAKKESGGTGNHPPRMTADPKRPTGGVGYRNGGPEGPGGNANLPINRPKRTTDNIKKPVDMVRKPNSSTYDQQIKDLARRRATENKSKARRKLFRKAA
jgi:hypothetical protein